MTSIDVVDSAVKIGLGALIAGIFSFVTTKVAHEREARMEYARRRRDLLEKVLALLNTFERIYRHQKALYDTFCIQSSPADRETSRREFGQLDEQFRVAFEGFADASGVLLMLGESEAEAALDEYREAANEWYEVELPEVEEFDYSTLDGKRANVVAQRKVVMEKLAAAYKNL